MNNRRGWIFFSLALGSWMIELGGGLLLVRWWWTVPWLGSYSLVNEVAYLGSSLLAFRGEVGLYWSPTGVLGTAYLLFITFYIIHALWGGFLYPLRRRWKLGVRRPTDQEQERFERACAVFEQVSGPLGKPRWLVTEGPGLSMRYVGYVLVVDRELLSHRYFPALLSHELAYANSEDRLAHALYRLFPPVLLVGGVVCGWAFSVGHCLTYLLWMYYFRWSVFAADRFAVQLGQGPALLRALEEIYLRVERPAPGGRLLLPAPYVAERISRIRLLLQQAGPSVSRII